MTPPPAIATLTALLRQAIDDRTGAPLRDIQARVEAEEAARPRGMSLNRSTASQILRGAYRGTPSPATVRAIGWLAGVSDEVAFAAAGQPAPGRPLADELPQAANTLDHHERAVVVDVVRALLSHRNDADEWKTTTAATLHGVGSDLLRIAAQLDTTPAVGVVQHATDTIGEVNGIISVATQELAQIATLINRLAGELTVTQTSEKIRDSQ